MENNNNNKTEEKDTRTFRKGEIYVVSLNKMYIDKNTNHIQKKQRPCIIVSNNACNTHSEVIHVIPITAELDKKVLKTHVHIGKKFGLIKESMALAECVTTVNKCIIHDKLVGILDEDTMNKVEEALKIQFNIGRNFDIQNIIDKINRIEELKNSYKNNKNSQKDLDLYRIAKDNLEKYCIKFKWELDEYLRDMKIKITDIYKNKNYHKCIEECDKLLLVTNYLHKNFYNWFLIFRKALCLKQLKDYTECIKMTKDCMKYISREEDYKTAECLWLIGKCYQLLDGLHLSKEYYEKCIQYYYKYEEIKHVADIKCNIGLVTFNENLVFEAMDLRQRYDFLDENIIDLYYETIIRIHLYKGEKEKAIKYLNLIKNVNIRENAKSLFSTIIKYNIF